MNISKVILITLLLFLPVFSFAQTSGEEVENLNAGFVSGVWFSKQPLFAEEEVRIYGAIQNHSGFDIDGTLRFFDRGKVIGEKDFSALDGALIQEWIDWEVTEGEHEITVEIVEATRSEPGSGSQKVELSSRSSSRKVVVQDKDTDGDGVGNKKDLDDDGDGFSDEEEKEKGTDPLDPKDFPEEKIENATSTEREKTDESVIGRAKEIEEEIDEKTKPALEKAQDFFEKQEERVLLAIEEDRNKLVSGQVDEDEEERGVLRKFADKLPPVFRLVYLWFLRLFIWILGAWWKVLLSVFVLWFLVRKVYSRIF